MQRSSELIKYYTYNLQEECFNKRIDTVLAEKTNMSRSFIQKLLTDKLISIDGNICTPASRKIQLPCKATIILLPDDSCINIAPANIQLDVVYEDDDLLVINKQAGLVVHPGVSHINDTLVNALVGYIGSNLSTVGGITRPGIVHRLDKDTSGLLLVAKNDITHAHLSKQISERSCKRSYMAITWGALKTKGTVKTLIDRSRKDHLKMAVTKDKGKDAITHYEPINLLAQEKLSLIKCTLETGRTHQIRVHMAHIGCPILGDQTYGNNTNKIATKFLKNKVMQDRLNNFTRQWLHASNIKFVHPVTGKLMEFTSEPAEELKEILELLN